jgi:hypothetical protein
MSGQLHAPVALTRGEGAPVPNGYEVGWAPDPVLDAVEKRKFLKLPVLELQLLGRAARRWSLYAWAIPAPNHVNVTVSN